MKPELMSASFTFGQEGNTEGTTSEYEEITIDYENPLGNHHGFFVLRTQGWSIDNLEELGELLERIKKIDTERGMRKMSEQELILRAEISDKEEADEAMAILRKDYDPTYVWCADCDYIVVKEKDCCNNKNKEK